MRVAACVFLVIAASLGAQHVPDVDPRVLELALERARVDLAAADSLHARTRRLFEQNLVSAAELEARAMDRERAALSMLERWTAYVARTPRLRVLSARKARGTGGATVVRVRLAAIDPSPVARETPHSAAGGHALVQSHAGADAFVSIKDEPGAAGTAIGVPYERRLPFARSGSATPELEFRLLRDADAVVVSLSWAGRTEERKVWLEADDTGTIAVQPMPYSQEADVGADAIYDLTIERFAGVAAPLRLVVHGLPPAIAHGFTDAETGTRIGQLRFAPGEHRRRVRLALVLPVGGTGAMVVDSAYRFLAVAVPESAGAMASDAGAAGVDAVAWRRAGAGVAELELVARGVGRAELRVFNLFHELDEASSLEIDLPVRNAGSRALDRARIEADLPPGWSVSAQPEELRDIPPGVERTTRLTITPSPGAELGDYEVRVRIEGSSGRSRLTGEPTVLRLRLRARRSAWTGAAFLGALVAAGAATLMVMRRLARR